MQFQRVAAEPLIHAVAEQLKGLDEIEPPVWAAYAKTGVHKERPPMQDDWWYIRSAAILRKVALRGPIGTNKLRTLYGGRKNRGHKPDRFRKGSGNVIRSILQQLEAAGLVKHEDVLGHKGRVLTPKGQALLAKATKEVSA